MCCIIQVAMTFSVCKYIQKEVDTRILQTYQFREWCIKPNQILMSWSLLCMCCKEQLPLLFRRIKYGHTSVLQIWDRLYVMVYMYLACTYLYMLYIPQTDLLDSVETSLGKWSIIPCHGFGENVKPGADALKQTLKAITYVICIMQHNASALTWYAVHQQVSLNCSMSQ